jgi:hypothetical protein
MTTGEIAKLTIDTFADGEIVCLKFIGAIDESFDGKKGSKAQRCYLILEV